MFQPHNILNAFQRTRTVFFCLSLSGVPLPAMGAAQAANNQDLFALPLEELLNMQVTIATLEPSSIHDAPGIITRISHEEIKSLNPRNITDILNLTPGFNMVVGNMHEPLLQLRGTGNRQDNVLLLIDGHRLNSQLFGSGTFIINDLPVEMIDHIEIIRGPGSALYGSNAFEAVINIITVPEQDTKQGLIYGKYGTDDTINGGTTYTSKDQDRHLVFSAGGLDSNGPNDPYMDRSGASGTVEFPQAANNLYANARQGNWGILALRNVENTGPYIGSFLLRNDNTDREYTTTAVEGSYSRDFDHYGAISLKTYYDEFDYDCLFELMPATYFPPNGYFKDATATDSRLGADFTWKKTFFTNHRLLLGTSYDQLKLYNSTLRETDPSSRQMEEIASSWINPEENSHYAFFFQDQFPLFSKSHITLGVRYDDYDKYGDTVNPRLGLTTPINAESQVKLLYGTAFRAPSYFEANAISHHSGQLLNADIKPEQLETIEAEYSVQKPHLSWRANTFYTEIKDIIETVTVMTGGTTKMNTGTVNTYGLETEAKKFFFDNRHAITINGYLNHAKDDNGDRVTHVPQYGAALILTNQWFETWSTSIQAKYTGQMEKDPVTNSSGAIIAEVENLPATITCNLSMAWSLGDITIRGLLYNMFEEPLYSPAPSRLDSAGDTLADFPYQGRFAMLSLEYAF